MNKIKKESICLQMFYIKLKLVQIDMIYYV